MTERDKRLTLGQNALWNTAGSLFYNLCLWATTAAAVRLTADYTVPGQLQLAMAVTNIFAVISSWELKTGLVADVRERYAVSDYLRLQSVSGAAAVALCLGYAALCGYGVATLAVVGLYMLFRALGSRSEVYYGVEQRHYRMDGVGISYLLRGTGMLLGFVLVLRFTGSLAAAAGAMAAVTGAVLVLYDRRTAARRESIGRKTSRPFPWRLGKELLPAVLALALFTAVATVPRQVLKAVSGTAALGAYATVATPVVVLQVLAVGIFDPGVRAAAELWDRGETRALRRLGGRLLSLLALLGALGLLGARYLGRWALVLLYGESIAPYSGLLGPVVIVAVLYSACWLMSRVLILLREMNFQLGVTVLCLAAAALTARPWIAAAGSNGVSWAAATGYGLYFLVTLFYVALRLRRREKEREA